MNHSPQTMRNDLLIAELCNHPVYGERFRKYEAIAQRLTALK